MKKKIRSMTVADRLFKWRIIHVSEHFVCLRIWRAEQPSSPWAQVQFRFDDPWGNFGEMLAVSSLKGPEALDEHYVRRPVTPRLVSDVIRLLLGRDERVHNWAWLAGYGVYPIIDATTPVRDPFVVDRLAIVSSRAGSGCELHINGKPLTEMVGEVERSWCLDEAEPALAGAYVMPTPGVLRTVLLGGSGSPLLLMVGTEQAPLGWELTVCVLARDDEIVLFNFRQVQRDWIYPLGPYVFQRVHVERDLAHA